MQLRRKLTGGDGLFGTTVGEGGRQIVQVSSTMVERWMGDMDGDGDNAATTIPLTSEHTISSPQQAA